MLYKYTSQRDDVATGLMYYKARYYDPGIGRFISADSIVPDAGNSQAYNRYMYVAGNPITYNDPDGHGFTKWAKKVAATTVGAFSGAVAGAYVGAMAGSHYGPAGMIMGAIIGAGVGAAVGGTIGYKYGTDRALGAAYYAMYFGTYGYAAGFGNPYMTVQFALSGAMMGGKLGFEKIFSNPGLALGGPVYHMGYDDEKDKWTFKKLKSNAPHILISHGTNTWIPGSGFFIGLVLEVDQYFGLSQDYITGPIYKATGKDISPWNGKNKGLFGDDNEESKAYDRGRDLLTWSTPGA